MRNVVEICSCVGAPGLWAVLAEMKHVDMNTQGSSEVLL